MRIGFGFDAHRFAPGRRLILGGLEVRHPLGLEGHSDADVVTHAIIDAILGAAGLQDIGGLFPDTDPRYRDAASIDLLAQALEFVLRQGFRVVNVDATVVCEDPKIAPLAESMRQALSAALRVEPSCVSIKGKTTERMGFTGRQEGIACYAVALLEKAGP